MDGHAVCTHIKRSKIKSECPPLETQYGQGDSDIARLMPPLSGPGIGPAASAAFLNSLRGHQGF